jgi:chromosomal replication initiator protein
VSENLTVEAPNAFHRNWVREHYLDRIEATIHTLAGRPVPVSLAVNAAVSPVAMEPATAPRPLRVPSRARSAHVEELTFDSFVVGPCNELAFLACRAAADAPGRQYNPLFIHGGVGLGKTHLIHAVANAVRARFRSYRVLAVGAEFFLNEMVSAVRRQQMETFHQRFRRVDTLVVDDVQFIAGKERTQEEFLHTFNRLCSAGKQIVVTSDKPPAAIPRLEAGLRSRFEGGMIAEVSQPDLDTRRRILDFKATAAGMPLSDEVGAYLAEHIRALSVRELEGTLTRLRAMSSLSGRPVDLELARAAVGAMYPTPRRRASVERIEAVVGQGLHIEPKRLLSAQRSLQIVFARQVAMYLLRKLLGMSLSAIGERYDRDHTTVLHAVRAIDARRRCDPEVRRLVMMLEEKL